MNECVQGFVACRDLAARKDLDSYYLFHISTLVHSGIPALTSFFFLHRLNRRYKCDVRLCSDVIREFQTRRWPGNVTELAAALHEVFMVQGQSLGNTIPTPS